MTEIDISFNDEVDFFSDTRKNWKTWIEELILSAKKNIKKTNRQEMSINFVDINKIHEINKNYRGKDRPTDVISFAIEDGTDNDLFAQFIETPDQETHGKQIH
jgi:probable rRNA maturation factor